MLDIQRSQTETARVPLGPRAVAAAGQPQGVVTAPGQEVGSKSGPGWLAPPQPFSSGLLEAAQ